MPLPVAVPVPLPPLPPAKWSRSPRREDASGGAAPPTPPATPPSPADWSEAARARAPLASSNHHGAQGPPTVPAGRAGSAARTRPSPGGRFATGSRCQRGSSAPRPAAPAAPAASLPHRRHAEIFSPFLRGFFGAFRRLKARGADSPRGPGAVLEGKGGPGAGAVPLIFMIKNRKKSPSEADFDTSTAVTTGTPPRAGGQERSSPSRTQQFLLLSPSEGGEKKTPIIEGFSLKPKPKTPAGCWCSASKSWTSKPRTEPTKLQPRNVNFPTILLNFHQFFFAQNPNSPQFPPIFFLPRTQILLNFHQFFWPEPKFSSISTNFFGQNPNSPQFPPIFFAQNPNSPQFPPIFFAQNPNSPQFPPISFCPEPKFSSISTNFFCPEPKFSSISTNFFCPEPKFSSISTNFFCPEPKFSSISTNFFCPEPKFSSISTNFFGQNPNSPQFPPIFLARTQILLNFHQFLLAQNPNSPQFPPIFLWLLPTTNSGGKGAPEGNGGWFLPFLLSHKVFFFPSSSSSSAPLKQQGVFRELFPAGCSGSLRGNSAALAKRGRGATKGVQSPLPTLPHEGAAQIAAHILGFLLHRGDPATPDHILGSLLHRGGEPN
ncbi:DNA-directed RNA polymerase II subunit RPB1-like [Motacilla alba alba]|uniref:DNA-directed RNA polymerase II subunit RPB1-like n=1 Tax=Motacilla alba alba TaxID=1094192 RepID=UPI0018D534CC|nr:DNA-directed RNA polymerase II subunit RPB1-like [Motacilla alba alba]